MTALAIKAFGWQLERDPEAAYHRLAKRLRRPRPWRLVGLALLGATLVGLALR